ncbi:MAG: M48 family metallopeptidase [Elusimicrobia bacterium]|nr:M48 family metallopeptidase [Elusimicrobiota bacterium]
MRKKGFALLLSAALLAACRSVPYTGRRHLVLVSLEQEESMGAQAYEETLKKSQLSDDSKRVEMIRRVGNRLAEAADRPDFDWEFALIKDDKTVNAWCLPGGKVAFYTGILPVTQDEEGVAVVMGHEIAHAIARHGAERMSQGLLAQFGGTALSLVLARQPAAVQDIYARAYGLGVTVGVLLPYSRKQESEADRIGLILMAKAGYEPEQAIGFWGRMGQLSEKKRGGGEPSPLERYLGTHPSDEQRQENIRKWLPEAMRHYRPARIPRGARLTSRKTVSICNKTSTRLPTGRYGLRVAPRVKYGILIASRGRGKNG